MYALFTYFRGKRSGQFQENINVLADDFCRAVAESEQEAQESPRFQSEIITAADYTATSESFSFPQLVYIKYGLHRRQ